MPKKRIRLRPGDVFEIKAPDGKLGYGQIIIAGDELYIVIFKNLYSQSANIDDAAKGEILLVGRTVDALFYHEQWTVVGNTQARSDVPYPFNKVRIDGEDRIKSFDGKHEFPASDKDREFYDYRWNRAPIGFERAFLAFHGYIPPQPGDEELTIEHAVARSKWPVALH